MTEVHPQVANGTKGLVFTFSLGNNIVGIESRYLTDIDALLYSYRFSDGSRFGKLMFRMLVRRHRLAFPQHKKPF